jgi:beta-phosphoglucomutase-like phosphatase (HAD superfamily)
MAPAGLVFEDAPSGIRSGRAAGCKTVGLLTTHSREQIESAQPDFIVKDLSA